MKNKIQNKIEHSPGNSHSVMRGTHCPRDISYDNLVGKAYISAHNLSGHVAEPEGRSIVDNLSKRMFSTRKGLRAFVWPSELQACTGK